MKRQPGQPSSIQLTWRLLRRVRRHGGILIAAILSMIVASLADVAPIFLAKGAVGVLFPAAQADDPSRVTEWFLDAGPWLAGVFGVEDADPHRSALVVMVALVLVVGAVSAAATFASSYFGRLVSALVVMDLRCAMMQKVLAMPVGWFTRRKMGDLLSRFATDVQQTYHGVNAFMLVLVHKPIILAFALSAAFALNWRLALAALTVVPLLIIPVVMIGRKVNKYSRKSLVSLGESTEAVNQSLAGLRVIKAFAAEEHEDRRYREINRSWLHRNSRMNRAFALGRGLMDMVYAMSLAIVLALGGWLVLTGKWNMDHETFASFLVALATMYAPLRLISKAYHNWQASMAAAGRVFDVLAEPEHGEEDDGSLVDVGPIRESIVFDGVSFTYREDGEKPTPVLKNVSFEIASGETVALVGPSGSGKSTIADLIFRFRQPDAGRILIDGRPLEGIRHRSLLEQVAIVSQRPFLFNTSIRENIAYGRPTASEDEIVAAARAAQVHDRILALPDGYDTVAGEQGGALSGGELQRVTIARAILKDASFLLLDEATSSLDAESERAVQKALRNLLRGRTTLIIAHRLSTIIDTDKILVIKDGRIVEQGKHEELLGQGGTYASLYRAQET